MRIFSVYVLDVFNCMTSIRLSVGVSAQFSPNTFITSSRPRISPVGEKTNRKAYAVKMFLSVKAEQTLDAGNQVSDKTNQSEFSLQFP